MRRTAVEHEVDRVAELLEDGRRIARLGQPGHVGRGDRQRADRPGQGAGRVVVRGAQADRRGAAGQDRRQGTSGRCGHDHRQAARPARLGEGRGGRGHDPDPAAWAASSSRSMIPLSGGRRLAANRRSMPPGVVERDADAVDRVGRQGHDAAGAQDLGRRRPTGLVVGDDRARPVMPTPPGRSTRLGRQPARGGHARRPATASTSCSMSVADALVGDRRGDVAGDRPDLGRRAGHGRPVADLGEHLDGRSTGRRRPASPRAARAAGGPGSARPGPWTRPAPRTRGSAGARSSRRPGRRRPSRASGASSIGQRRLADRQDLGDRVLDGRHEVRAPAPRGGP